MLYDRESISNYGTSNIVIWMLMAFQGGFLNMAGLMACHRFVSHITGYSTMFSFELGKHNFQAAALMALVPICFFLGAILSGLLVDVRLKLNKKPRYYISFGLIFLIISTILLMGDLGFFGAFGEPLLQLHDYILLALLAFVCGIQNGTITSVSKAVIRTTHLSGITTDLGIGIARMFYKKKLNELIQEEKKANFMRMGIITFFTLGSFLAYNAFITFAYNGFFVPLITSGVLFFTMIYFAFIRKLVS